MCITLSVCFRYKTASKKFCGLSAPGQSNGRDPEESDNDDAVTTPLLNDRVALSSLSQAQFKVSGLSCASCVAKIEKHLKKKKGRNL